MRILAFLWTAGVFFAVLLFSCQKENKTATAFYTDNVDFMASKASQNRVCVLEDFCGVRCDFCPDGHARAKAIADANPGKFIVLAVHAGDFAEPAAGWANFTTAFGNALILQAKVSGYPAGTINRMLCSELGVNPQKAGGYAMSRGSWATAAGAVFGKSAPVNLGAKATFDAGKRMLTVYVDLYYTSTENVQNNLNVLLVQDGLISGQKGGTPDADNYEQNHVVRDFITGQWGEVIGSSIAAGSQVRKMYTYTVPDFSNGSGTDGGGAVVIDNLKVVAFVAQGQTNILNAVEADVQ